MTGPFDVPDDQMGGLFNPFEQTSLTQFDQLNAQQAAASPFGRVVQGIGVVGKTLQPFAAPQQVLFGGVKALADVATGDGDQAWTDFKRGTSSALAYLTYQHGGDLPGILKNKNAPQSNPITGYDLFRQVGAPQWVARWGGTAADFLLDVPILGAVGKAAKVDKLTAGLRIGENMARSFDSPAALRAFVGGVTAAPFTTQPIKVAVEAIPQGLRQAGRERLIDPLLNARAVPRSEFDPVKPTVGQTLFNRDMNVPAPITDALERKNAVVSQYAVLQNEAASAFDQASKGLGFADKKELGKLVGRLADESDPAMRVQIEGDIRALESRTGRVGLFNDAIRATNKGIQFDVFSAEKLTAAGLMDPAELAKYQAGDKRHLRRVMAMYGERPEDQLRRLMDRNSPGSVTFDSVALQNLYTTTLTRGIPMPNTIPTPQDFAREVQAAYVNPSKHPADFLNDFFTSRGMSSQHVTDILDGIAGRYAQDAGIKWLPPDEQVVRQFAAKRAAEASGPAADLGGRGVTAVTTQRLELDDAYLEVLGEVEDFTTRLNAQGRVAAKAASVNGVVREIRDYLTGNNLIETLDTADLGSVYRTAGLRVINGEQARALGNGFKEGEVIPAEVHRILVEQVSARKDAPLGLAWQWYSSRWQGVKLANPASIATNLKSAFVMANQTGVNPVDLTRGIVDYLRLHRQAVRGDGALDTAANVNGVNMAELFNHGAFTHNTLMNSEVVQQSSRLLDELANPAGNGMQRSVAALQNWLTETQQGATLAGAYRTAVTPMRWLGDTYGRVDSVMKGGLYMHLRKQGMAPEKAAKVADETFFNYQNVPYVVDGLRRFGLLGMPFASFKFLAAGRFFKAMYQNPYGVDRYYRLTNSSQAAMADQPGDPNDPRNALAEYQAGSPEYVKKGLYIPLGRDSEGRVRAVRLDDILPETAIFDAFNADGVAGTIPPAVQLAAQITSGKGYQGRDVYRTGDTLSSTAQLDPQEAARGVVASLWQFGAYPWAPGQPMTERIVKALADKSVPVDTITDPTAQAVLKFLASGPAAPFDQAAFSTDKKGAQPVPDRADALARLLGVKAYPVTTTPSEPGSARSNQQGLEAQLSTLDRMQDQEMRSAMSDAQRSEIRRRYDAKRAPIIEKLRAK